MSSTKPPNTLLALVDCNNFYASCEQVFDPSLEKKPLLILSNNDGCVIARSQKAKEMGVKMGDPSYLFREEASRGELKMLSSNFALYADMSQRVMQTLESFSSDIEIYSIDEAFFSLEARADLVQIASAMRSKVKKWTGIPVSIGIAKTKTLAKLASKAAKKGDGVFLLENPETLLDKTLPEDIWGIGGALAERLKKNGIYTAGQLAKTEDGKIRKLLGVTGLRTALELRGTPCIELDEEQVARKSIVCSRSFKEPLTTIEPLAEALAAFAARAAEKLRAQKSLTSFLSIFIATSPFKEGYVSKSCHIEIPIPSNYTPDLIALAKEGLSRIFQKGLSYKKAGVLLENFSSVHEQQMDLLSPIAIDPKKQKAMQSFDQINARYGKASVQFAAEGLDQKWRGKRESVSPKFTTSWQDLLKVK